MHTPSLTFNAIISGTIAADTAQMALARQRKSEASNQAPSWPFAAIAAGSAQRSTKRMDAQANYVRGLRQQLLQVPEPASRPGQKPNSN